MSGQFDSRVAINGNCFRGKSLQHDLTYCEDNGLEHLTVPIIKIEQAGRAEGIAAIQKSAVQPTVLILPNIFTLHERSAWPAQTDRLLGAIDIAEAVGAQAIYTTTGPAGALGWDEAVDALAQAVRPGVEKGADRGIRLLVEPTNPIYAHLNFVYTLRDTVDLTRRTGLGLVVDFFACYYERGMLETLREAAAEIAFVQISDYVPGGLSPENPGGLSVGNRAVPGDGVAPLEAAVETILAGGYEGLFDLEIFGPRVESEGEHEAVSRGALWISQALERFAVAATP